MRHILILIVIFVRFFNSSGLCEGNSSATELSKSHCITIKEYTIFDGNKGYQLNGTTYRLACGPTVAECPNGDLLCAWLSGSDNEPATDNCALISHSCDGGQTWSAPSIIAPAGNMAGCFGNMRRTSNHKMVAFTAKWPSDKNYTEWHYFKTESLDNGLTWSKPVPFTVHDNHVAIGSAPIRLSTGEYLYGCSFFDKRPKPLTGPRPLLARAKNEAEASAIAESENEAQRPGEMGTHLHGCSVLIAKDDETTEFTEFGYIANRPAGLLEPTVIRLKNSNIAMLMRVEWGGFLWRSDSNDNGRTWSKAWQTDIPNCTSSTKMRQICL